jgi:hypothetical protein
MGVVNAVAHGIQEEESRPTRPIELQHLEASAKQDEPAKSADEPTVVETVDNSQPVNPREIRLHLWDGSVITGELAIDEMTVETEFGNLSVPVSKIISFRPGLDSFPQLGDKIDQLVEALGSEDYKTREQAHKGLVAMGLQLRREIYRFQDDGNAERKRHLEEIRKEIESMVEDLDEDFESSLDDSAELIRGDAVATKDFVIVGKIAHEQFEVASKYGLLAVKLMDVQFADRRDSGNIERRATVSVDGKNYAHANSKATGIRLNRGDRVSIRVAVIVVPVVTGVRCRDARQRRCGDRHAKNGRFYNTDHLRLLSRRPSKGFALGRIR